METKNNEVKDVKQKDNIEQPQMGAVNTSSKQVASKEAAPFELSEEEKINIARGRARQEEVNKCQKELQALLTKYKMELRVNPQSPLNAPAIMLVSIK